MIKGNSLFFLPIPMLFYFWGQAQDYPIDAERICEHIEVLASDEFEGRQTGTSGEEKTIEYIARNFQRVGLEPANGDSYLQQVHLAKFSVVAPGSINLKYPEETEEWRFKEDFLLASTFAKEQVRIDQAQLVFAGFGIYAPEIGWDDYKNVDVEGKIVVVLSGVPSEYTTDTSLWKGDPAANLYGQTFYKKNEAARRGAIGLFTIYRQSQQGLYNWESLANYVGQNTTAIKKPIDETQLKFSGLLKRESTQRLFEKAGKKGYDFQKEPLKPRFHPLLMDIDLSFNFSNTWEDIKTHNVVGLLPGTDLADEVMIYSAHWDHVGILPGAEGDSIRNGAVDNASGTAALIEIARAFKNRLEPFRRSVLFLATAAEEMGLLGAVWYADNPIFPIGKTVANFNMDSHYPYGKTTLAVGVVYGRSGLDKYLDEAARLQNRIIYPNTEQNIAANIFFRSDHFPFAEVGVPSEFAVGGGEAMGHDNEVFQKKLMAYQYKYHQPSDEYEEDYNCEGIAQDAELILHAGWLIDREGAFPHWDPQQPFDRYRREARYASSLFQDVSDAHIPARATQGKSMDAKPADLDGDGDPDLLVANEWGYNVLLINDGQGRFSDESDKRLPLKRHDSEDVAVADFDDDGDLDIIFVSEDDQVNEYYLNDGQGFFKDHSHQLPLTGKSNAVLTLDVNQDGFPDLLIGNDGPNFCLLNDGKGHWTPAPDRIPTSSKTTQDLEAGDIDGDGDLDIINGNEDGNEIWINDGKGNFTDQTKQLIKADMSAWESREADFGDVDGDGDLDLFFANVNFRQDKNNQNRLLLNDGKGHFTDVSAIHLPSEKMHSVDGDFIDLDRDGDLDIVTANSFGNSFEFYLNDGKGKFTKETDGIKPPSIKGDGIDIEAADFNGDGKVDLYLCNFMGRDMLLLGR